MWSRWAHFASHASTAYVVLAIGIVLSAAVAYWMQSRVQRELLLKFENTVADTQVAMDSSIRAYSDVLIGVRGLFIASDFVSRSEFRDYIDSLGLSHRYPGVHGINYGQRIPAAQGQAFVATARNDTSVDPRGYPGFAISPPGKRPEYVVVKYVEPMAGNEAALGFDLAGDAAHLAAFESARDSGRVTASGIIAQPPDPRPQPGFALHLAVYRKGLPLGTVAQRREAFGGMVSAEFIVIDLVRGVLSEPFLQAIHVRIHDAGIQDNPNRLQPPAAENLMFDSDRLLPALSARQAADGGEIAGLSRSASLEVGGHRWHVQYSACEEFVSFSDRWLPSAVMLGGVVISLLLFWLMRSLASVGGRAVALAPGITDAPRDDPRTRVYETSVAIPDEQHHDTIYYKAALTHADGGIAGLIDPGIDISERKRAEQALVESETRYRSLIAAIAEGVVVRDRNGVIVTCNASAARILGRTLEQMKGSNYYDPRWEWFREDGTPVSEDQRTVTTALRTGQAQSNVVIGLRKEDGSVLWLSMNAQPLFGESDSTPTGVVTTLTDITQRKQAETRQAMEHSVTRLLSGSETAEEVAPKIIRNICEALGFACGARMLRDENGQAIRCAETWSVPSAEVLEFVAAGRQPVYAEQTEGGLIGRVWASGEPLWITDVVEDASFLRAPLAAAAGLHGAFAFPIVFGNDVLGVMAFFSRARHPPDDVLLQSVRSIGAQIGQFIARRQAEERVHHLAHYDELTGLPNRSMFNQRFSHALARARRHDKPLAILFIDLDRFKNINDTLGHEGGDHVLREVAQRLLVCLREGDTVGRLGGDEFVVLIEELTHPMQVAGVAQKIIAAVAQPIILEAHEFHITASIGISTHPDDSDDMPGLLKMADISMYRAKAQGKNNYQFYSEQLNIHTLERLALESGLRRALERNEFLLHYEAKVDIASGRITGMEALLRWQRPGHGLIPPAQFVEVAEETGLIVPIGEWVLRTACARNKSWQDQGLPPLRIAVNLPARLFAHADLLQEVARVLRETGLDPAALEFEITESVAMHDPERAVALLTRLKAMGIRLSIDDFGAGYSSLSYLKRFPIDSVKIDRSFIRDIPGDTDASLVTRAIIAMAHSLRLNVIAEGVETGVQLGFLREHGCDEIQGPCFSEPLAEDEFLRLQQSAASGGAA